MSKQKAQKAFTPQASAESACPCQSGQIYSQCCGRFLAPPGSIQTLAATAEQLMRSRYTAYVQGNSEYLLKTWHPQYRPEHLELTSAPQQWLGLNIKQTQQGQMEDHSGTVHFVARYKINGKASRLEENSRFVKIDGQWFYTDGQIL